MGFCNTIERHWAVLSRRSGELLYFQSASLSRYSALPIRFRSVEMEANHVRMGFLLLHETNKNNEKALTFQEKEGKDDDNLRSAGDFISDWNKSSAFWRKGDVVRCLQLARPRLRQMKRQPSCKCSFFLSFSPSAATGVNIAPGYIYSSGRSVENKTKRMPTGRGIQSKTCIQSAGTSSSSFPAALPAEREREAFLFLLFHLLSCLSSFPLSLFFFFF